MVIGDGYIPYHIRVRTEAASPREFHRIVDQATAIKHELEGRPRPDQFPDGLIEWLAEIPGAARVSREGAISSVLAPLKMIRTFGARPCAMYGVVGSGPVADAIREDLSRRDIELRATVRPEGDASIEIGFEDLELQLYSEFQVHFLPIRSRSHIFRLEVNEEQNIEAFLISRPNHGRRAAAGSLFRMGRLVSLRVGGFSQHLHPDDYLRFLSCAHQVLVHEPEIASISRTLGISVPQRWQAEGGVSLLRRIAETLATSEGGRRLVVLTLARTAYLSAPECSLMRFQLPESRRHMVSSSRFHGALIALSLNSGSYVPKAEAELEALGNRALQASSYGCDGYPLQFPEATFTVSGSWRT